MSLGLEEVQVGLAYLVRGERFHGA
jgi:hypothetical protein